VTTSPKAASRAAKILRNPKSPASAKSVAASDLSQAKHSTKKKLSDS
jgi:hypothetical protein